VASGDILDVSSLALALQGVEEVYHCAGLVTFNLRRKDELIRMNAEGTANMVNASLDARVRKFLHVSSVSALGRNRQDQVVTEASQWEEAYNNSNYGRSKWRAELEVWRGIGEGLQAVIVNPTVVLGMGNWNTGSSALFKNIYYQFPWYSDGVTGFVDADDVAKAMVELMASEITAERFILNGESQLQAGIHIYGGGIRKKASASKSHSLSRRTGLAIGKNKKQRHGS
jgi:nucleoside-diphosphate-sugar epimerase